MEVEGTQVQAQSAPLLNSAKLMSTPGPRRGKAPQPTIVIKAVEQQCVSSWRVKTFWFLLQCFVVCVYYISACVICDVNVVVVNALLFFSFGSLGTRVGDGGCNTPAYYPECAWIERR
jgi:hypothetical protein